MTARSQMETNPERPEMHEKPRLFDDLGLVALPMAVSCARMFAEYTLTKWGASTFVVADALVVAQELVALSVQDMTVMTRCAHTICWAVGVNAELIVSICPGWMAAFAPNPGCRVGPDLIRLCIVDIEVDRSGSRRPVLDNFDDRFDETTLTRSS